MKRSRRIIFNGLTVLSLLTCAVVVVLWVRSYRVVDIVRIGEVRSYKLASGDGGIFIEWLRMFRRTGYWTSNLNPATGHLSIYNESSENYTNFLKLQRKLSGAALHQASLSSDQRPPLSGYEPIGFPRGNTTPKVGFPSLVRSFKNRDIIMDSTQSFANLLFPCHSPYKIPQENGNALSVQTQCRSSPAS
jgi:hypothetical protein